mmetsp:Transcript_26610/g.57437  ORF Transcript_26610/g.57437 Transcript_26610/m.57437 type:complete len:213 (+) Transcript_26610:389-1027(+)
MRHPPNTHPPHMGPLLRMTRMQHSTSNLSTRRNTLRRNRRNSNTRSNTRRSYRRNSSTRRNTHHSKRRNNMRPLDMARHPRRSTPTPPTLPSPPPRATHMHSMHSTHSHQHQRTADFWYVFLASHDVLPSAQLRNPVQNMASLRVPMRSPKWSVIQGCYPRAGSRSDIPIEDLAYHEIWHTFDERRHAFIEHSDVRSLEIVTLLPSSPAREM